MRRANEIVAAARACVGAPFRRQGRDPAFGLDCVGLAAIAFDTTPPPSVPHHGGTPERAGALIGSAGAQSVASNAARAGDLLLVDCGLRQLHLLVLTPTGFVHADAGLRRVTEVPGDPPWPVLGAWRASN